MNYYAYLSQLLPDKGRKVLYKAVKYLSAIATIALLVLPALPGLGISLPEWAAALTGALTFVSHLADSNLHLDDPASAEYPAVAAQDNPVDPPDAPVATPAAPTGE